MSLSIINMLFCSPFCHKMQLERMSFGYFRGSEIFWKYVKIWRTSLYYLVQKYSLWEIYAIIFNNCNVYNNVVTTIWFYQGIRNENVMRPMLLVPTKNTMWHQMRFVPTIKCVSYGHIGWFKNRRTPKVL